MNSTKYSRLRMTKAEIEEGKSKEIRRLSLKQSRLSVNALKETGIDVQYTAGMGYISKCRCDEIQVQIISFFL